MSDSITQKKKNFFTKPVIIVIIGIVVFLLALALHPFDFAVKNYLQSCSLKKNEPLFIKFLFDLIATFGKGDLIAVLIVVVAAVGLRKSALKIALSVLLMTLMVWCLKPTVHRERPNGRNFVSFPSGDTATASAFFASTAIESPVSGPLFAIAPAVGFVRMYDNYHYLSDVAAGLAIGIIAAGLSLMIKIKKLKYLENLKPRLFLAAVFIMCLIMFLPDALRGRGLRLYFMELLAPVLFIWMISAYSKLFIFRAGDKSNLFIKLFKFKKYCICAVSDSLLSRLSSSSVVFFSGFLTVVSAILLVVSWIFIKEQTLLYSVTGLLIGIIATGRIVKKQYCLKDCRKSAIITAVNSFGILIFFAVVSLLPALFFAGFQI